MGSLARNPGEKSVELGISAITLSPAQADVQTIHCTRCPMKRMVFNRSRAGANNFERVMSHANPYTEPVYRARSCQVQAMCYPTAGATRTRGHPARHRATGRNNCFRRERKDAIRVYLSERFEVAGARWMKHYPSETSTKPPALTQLRVLLALFFTRKPKRMSCFSSVAAEISAHAPGYDTPFEDA